MRAIKADIAHTYEQLQNGEVERAIENSRRLWAFDSSNMDIIRLMVATLEKKEAWQQLNGVTRRALYFAPFDADLCALRETVLNNLNRTQQWQREKRISETADHWHERDQDYFSYDGEELLADKGAIYIAMDDKYISEAAFSARSLRKIHPDLPICLLTTQSKHSDIAAFDHVISIPMDFCLRYYFQTPQRFASVKAYCLRMSPYRQTLYLDSDTYIQKPLTAIFEALDYADFIFFEICNVKFSQKENEPPIFVKGLNCPYVADTGVLAFRKSSRIDHFFDIWFKRFIDTTMGENRFAGNWGKGLNDQGTLNKMIAENIFLSCNIRAACLPGWQYNCKEFCLDILRETKLINNVRLLHMNGLYDRFKDSIRVEVKDLYADLPREKFSFPLAN